MLTWPEAGNLSNSKPNTVGGSVCCKTLSNCCGCPHTLTALAMCSTHSSIFPWPNNSSPS